MKLKTHYHRIKVAAVSTLLTLVATLPTTQATENIQHAAGEPVVAMSLPDSVLRTQIEALPATAQIAAIDNLSDIRFSSADLPYLRVNEKGDVFIADHFDIPAYFSNEPQAIEPVFQNVTAQDAFSLHGKPGATRVIYLDFNGHTVTGTGWNSAEKPSFSAMSYDLDGVPGSFNATELSNITQIWRRVAEDFAPFDVDVTTEEPATFNNNTGRALITKNVDANGIAMPSSTAGGVAFVGVWGGTRYASYHSPAFIYYNNLAGGRADIVTEAVSHELGHNLGLSHDATSTTGYYGGHNAGNTTSWGPIMGTGYNRNVSQWSIGEYPDANNHEDDVSILANYLNNRTDDHSDTNVGATPLVLDSTGNVISTTPITDPNNTSSVNKGIIGVRGDRDTFQFDTSGGTVTLNANSLHETSNTHGGNLDIQLILHDSLGALVDNNDDAGNTNATITTSLAAGRYYVTIDGGDDPIAPYSDYGSLGQYFLSGNIPLPVNDTTPDEFTFVDQTGVEISSVITSAPITVSGINTATAISITNGKYSINGATYTNAAGTVNNGDQITVQHTSSSAETTATETVLTIGGINDTFSSVTKSLHREITIAFNPPGTHPLTPSIPDFTKIGGAVISSPSGINCSATSAQCTATFPIGTPVTLTATPESGYAFGFLADVMNNCQNATATNPSCTIDGQKSAIVAVGFTPTAPTLNVIKAGTGTGTVTSAPAGINCGTDCTETYTTSGQTITLTAAPATGSLFTSWSGDCTVVPTNTKTCKTTIAGAKTVTANFDKIVYKLTVTKAGNGTVSSTPAGIACGTDCTEDYLPSTSVALTATADPGYKFISWTGCTSTTNTCTVSMSAAKPVTATFRPVFALTVNKTGTGSGTVKATGINCDTSPTADCTETYLKDAVVSLTTTTATGSRFTGWSGACTGATTCSVTMTDAKNVTANFDKIVYTLTVTKAGNGTVSSTPAGIACGTDCTEDYLPATSVALTAMADPGYKFISWTGCTSTTNTCTVSMSAAKAVTATFKPVFTLTVNKTGTGSGTVKATGINCDTSAAADCTEAYLKDAVVSLTTTTATGSRFTGWSGACTGTTTCSVTMTAAKNVTANFDKIVYTLTVTKAGNGTVSSTTAGIACGTDCTEDYLPATSVTLTATADPGYKFVSWTGCTSTTNSCTVSMSAAKPVTATFRPVFALTVNKTGTGSGTVKATNINCDTSATADCTETYLKDAVVSLTTTAATGSRFTGWSGACSGATTCSITMTEAKNVTANFDKITYKLSITKSGNGLVVGSIPGIAGAAGINCGTSCEAFFPQTSPVLALTLTATADPGYKFTGWSGGCTGTASSCTVSMSAAKTVTATFKPIFTLTVNKTGNAAATGTVSSTPTGINCGTDCTEDYLSSAAVTLTARAATGSRFTGWSGACTGTSTCKVTMSAANAAVANFVTP